jgi:phosphatidylinositol dimannoside acyltransferase
VVVFFLWRLATALGRAVPRRVSDRAALCVADVMFLCWREKRANTIDNMAHVLPNADAKAVRRVARDSFRNYAKYLIDFIRTPTMAAAELAGAIEFSDWERLDDVFREGRGLIVAGMHFGSWDMGGALFGRHGYILNVIVDTFGHSKLNDMVVGSRLASGMRVIPMERAGVAVIRALRRNEALVILLDRPQAANGVSVRFFDGATVMPAGAARLALRTGARVVPAAVVRMGHGAGGLQALLDLDFHFEACGNDETDIRSLMEALLSWHEGVIREFPDQWYMFRRVWLTPPVPQA